MWTTWLPNVTSLTRVYQLYPTTEDRVTSSPHARFTHMDPNLSHEASLTTFNVITQHMLADDMLELSYKQTIKE